MKKDELTTETTANAKPKLAEVALHDVEIMVDIVTGNRSEERRVGKEC